MPQPPSEIRICGKPYALESIGRSALGADRVGEANHQELRITYDSTWALAQQQDTVLHEVLHCVEEAAGLELDEQTVASLATLLYGVLVDNPDFARWLTRQAK